MKAVMKTKKLLALILAVAITLSLTACEPDVISLDEPDAAEVLVTVDDNQDSDGDEQRASSTSSDLEEEELLETEVVPADITPLMWIVTSPDSEQQIYLFGSIHAADETSYPLPNVILDAFYHDSDYLAVEMDIVALETDMQAQMAMTLALMYGEGESIEDHIDDDLLESAVEAMLDNGIEDALMGAPVETLYMFKPFFWIQFLQLAAVEKAGLSAEYGLDSFFILDAVANGKEILEIESAESQMQMLTGFSDELQAAMLRESLDTDEGAAELIKLYAAWQRGNEQEFFELYAESDGMPQELHEEYIDGLLTQRDAHMADTIMGYMEDGMKVFVVVGAAHLVGENSVTGILRDNGYTVETVLY